MSMANGRVILWGSRLSAQCRHLIPDNSFNDSNLYNPMTKTVFVVALIRRQTGDSTCWLGFWNADSQFWDFPVFQRLETESIFELLQREISWRLQIDPREFLVARMAQLHVNPMESIASSSADDDEAELIFNSVNIYRKGALEALATNDNLRWLNARELCSGRTDDDQQFSPRIRGWLNRWQIIQPWD